MNCESAVEQYGKRHESFSDEWVKTMNESRKMKEQKNKLDMDNKVGA